MTEKQGKIRFLECVTAAFQPYKEHIEVSFRKAIAELDGQSQLLQACEYALQTGGKRFRPAMTLMIADALQKKQDATLAALGVEFFHTASLIADDLPCMDNDDERRGRPTTHKVFGETVALLASFALTAAGFEFIVKNGDHNPELAYRAAMHASRLNGIRALIGGQFLDLNPPELTREKLYDICNKKTGSMFELCLLMGWIYGGGALDREAQVKEMAFHFGAAYQLLDDLDDMEKDRLIQRQSNYANLFGVAETCEKVTGHLEQCKVLAQSLKVWTPQFQLLIEGMYALVSDFI